MRRLFDPPNIHSIEFGKRCREAGVRPSMGSVGDAYDNAMAESFFATPECELLDRRRFKTQAEARIAVFEFIEGFYNPRRRHSSLAYLSPMKFESQFAETSLGPDAHEHAVVLAPVKERPGNLAASRTPACRPSLTAAQHDSLSYMQAGTKRCSRPNQKIAQKRRTEYSQIRYPDPKTSPWHEIGASPEMPLRPRSARPFRLHARSKPGPWNSALR